MKQRSTGQLMYMAEPPPEQSGFAGTLVKFGGLWSIRRYGSNCPLVSWEQWSGKENGN